MCFDDFFQAICSSKAFFDIAPAGRNHRVSTIYIKHNLFHESELGPNFELRNTHFFLFKTPRDVNEVTKLSAQLGLRSELVEWYRHAKYLPYSQL